MPCRTTSVSRPVGVQLVGEPGAQTRPARRWRFRPASWRRSPATAPRRSAAGCRPRPPSTREGPRDPELVVWYCSRDDVDRVHAGEECWGTARAWGAGCSRRPSVRRQGPGRGALGRRRQALLAPRPASGSPCRTASHVVDAQADRDRLERGRPGVAVDTFRDELLGGFPLGMSGSRPVMPTATLPAASRGLVRARRRRPVGPAPRGEGKAQEQHNGKERAACSAGHARNRSRARRVLPRPVDSDTMHEEQRRRPDAHLDQAQQLAVTELLRVWPVVCELAGRFRAAGHELALVGGPVRDVLLGRACDDLDFTTDARPEEVLRLVSGWAEAVVGRRHRLRDRRRAAARRQAGDHHLPRPRRYDRDSPQARGGLRLLDPGRPVPPGLHGQRDGGAAHRRPRGLRVRRPLRRARRPRRPAAADAGDAGDVVLRRPAAHDARRALRRAAGVRRRAGGRGRR